VLKLFIWKTRFETRTVGAVIAFTLLAIAGAQGSGATPLIPSLYGTSQVEQITCNNFIMEDLEHPDVFAVQCFSTTLGVQEIKRIVSNDAEDLKCCQVESWYGWGLYDVGVWRGEALNKDGTKGEVFLFPSDGGGIDIVAYSLE
jgi:hypothetical protein